MVGWLLGRALERRLPLRAIRISLAAILLVLAILLALMARGLIG